MPRLCRKMPVVPATRCEPKSSAFDCRQRYAEVARCLQGSAELSSIVGNRDGLNCAPVRSERHGPTVRNASDRFFLGESKGQPPSRKAAAEPCRQRGDFRNSSINAPSFGSPAQTMPATGRSPRRSSGKPTTTASATRGECFSASSTSAGYTLRPPTMIFSWIRPVM
jgi:hypothetical protein